MDFLWYLQQQKKIYIYIYIEREREREREHIFWAVTTVLDLIFHNKIDRWTYTKSGF